METAEWQEHIRETQDSLRVLAEQTGGIAVVNQNDFDKALKRIDNETSDYYVLGYYSNNPDPLKRTRRIEVKTTRDGVQVWSRTSYSLRPTALSNSAALAPAPDELRPDLLEHAHHFRHRARQPSHLRIQPPGLPLQRVVGNPAAVQLLGLHVGGRRLPRNDADAEPVPHHRLDDLDVLGFHHDFRFDSLAREELVDQAPRDGTGLEQNERLTLQIGWPNCALPGERMGRIGDEQQLFLEDGHRHEIGSSRRAA